MLLVGCLRPFCNARLISLYNFHFERTKLTNLRRPAPPSAGRRNVFTEQPKGGEETQSLAHLYGSNRFNSDEDDDLDGSGSPLQPCIDQKLDEDTSEMSLPPAQNFKIKSAEFIKSSVAVADCPSTGFPEVAVIGRSNVGKSSLINLLTGRNSLAMVSKTPGKTRCINHFLINKCWYLVDLPGYGYAKASKEKVLTWNTFTREYFMERETLATVLLLIDASIPPTELDIACAQWLGDAEVPFTLVFTKVDKRKKGCSEAEENISDFQKELEQTIGFVPTSIVTSSRTGTGKNDLLAYLSSVREFWKKASL